MNSLSLNRRSLLLTAAAAAVAGVARARGATTRPVTLGQVSLSFYAVTGAVVQHVLERLEHQVIVRTGPHDEMFPMLERGAIDLDAGQRITRQWLAARVRRLPTVTRCA